MDWIFPNLAARRRAIDERWQFDQEWSRHVEAARPLTLAVIDALYQAELAGTMRRPFDGWVLEVPSDSQARMGIQVINQRASGGPYDGERLMGLNVRYVDGMTEQFRIVESSAQQ